MMRQVLLGVLSNGNLGGWRRNPLPAKSWRLVRPTYRDVSAFGICLKRYQGQADGGIMGRAMRWRGAVVTAAMRRLCRDRVISFDQNSQTGVAHHSPHYPLNEPPKWIAPYEKTIDDVWRRHYAAAVTHLDDGVGRILAALQRTGLREKTLIVFSSDNGGQRDWNAPENQYSGRYAAHTTLGNNQPLRGWKGDLYEGGIRVPSFVNWPEHVPKGRVFDSPTHVVDWLPTLLHVAGGEPDQFAAAEGIDLWPALSGKSSAIAERVMYWKTPSAAAVRQGDWKLIRYRRDNRSELFELKSDPLEQTDMAEREPERVRALSDLLDRAAENDQ